MKWLALFINIVLSILSCVFIKISSESRNNMSVHSDQISIANDKLYWIGFLCYALSFFSYAILIAKFPLQFAQTIVTSSIIVIISIFGSLFWKEPFYWTTGMGIIFITIGISLISFNTI